MSLTAFAQVLYDSEVGTALRESVYAFPIVEGLHLIGLAFSVGLILFVDLRLVGLVFRNVPVPDVLRPLRPWLLGGFTLTFITGIFLFIAEASKIIDFVVLPLKLFLIVLAGINALWFELKWGRRVDEWAGQDVLPKAVRFAGWSSIALWSSVVICGRLIPYLSYA
jgi:hypothetical protein